MRALTPADSLVYLETNDLAAALQPIIDSKPFKEAAKGQPDFGALKGVQVAVAVTGFETTEEKLTDETSVGRIQPRFVAIADTHAWNYQAVAFADHKLGQFVTDIYGADVTQDRIDKNEGDYFTWTSGDGRKSYAQVIGSVIYFGNDQTAIDKCLAVRRGEADSIAKTGKLPPRVPESLASGYVSTDGVSQIGNIVGIKFAADAGSASGVQTAIAGIVPQILRGCVEEISWSSVKTVGGIEDRIDINLEDTTAAVLNESLRTAAVSDRELLDFVPLNRASVTEYSLRGPQVAWRSLVLTAQSKFDGSIGGAFPVIAAALGQPYGIQDPELFLSGVGTTLVTVAMDKDGDKSALVAAAVIGENMRGSLLKELKPDKQLSDQYGLEVLSSADDEIATAFSGKWIVTGNIEAVKACLNAKSQRPRKPAEDQAPVPTLGGVQTVLTIGDDFEIAHDIASVLSESRDPGSGPLAKYSTRTRFVPSGIERRTVSDFGLIGSIISQLAEE
ncbi:MAG: hypothetical protein WKF34_04250 [Pyrinomonadaceae bacterium]